MPEAEQKAQAPVVIGFYGYSESGKTALIERLIRDLKAEGYRVAAIKVSGQAASLDQPGKDTWRYTQAGAGGVVLAAGGETDFHFSVELDMRVILRLLAEVGAPDVILVEGAREAFIRKIRLGEKDVRENTLWTYNGEYARLLEIIHKEMQKE